MEESDAEEYEIPDQLEIRMGRSRQNENPSQREARAGSQKKQQQHI